MSVNQSFSNPQYININLDVGTYQWLQISFWAFAIAVIIALVAVAYHFVHVYRTPKESKDIRSGSHMKKAGFLLVGDDGYADYEHVEYTGAEGWGETKSVGKKKDHYTGFFPRPGIAPSTEIVEDGKSQEKTEALANFINMLMTRKVFLRGAKTSLWVAVKPKAVLASIYGIAGIQLTEELANEWEKKHGSVFPIDIGALKRMVVSSNWNESQINALEATKINEGMALAGDKGAINKWAIIFGIAFAGIGFGCLVAAIFA